MVNLNANQLLSIIIVVLSVAGASTAQMTDLFGGIVAKNIASGAGILVAMLSGILAVITGQASQVKAVSNMPGIEPLRINAQANSTVAALALDPANAKIDVKPGAEAAVKAAAAG